MLAILIGGFLGLLIGFSLLDRTAHEIKNGLREAFEEQKEKEENK